MCVIVLCGALSTGGLSGCIAPERSGSATVARGADGRPLEIQPKPPGRGRSKQVQGELPILIVKAASPTPSAKGKKTVRTKPKTAVPTGTNVPFYFSIESGFWPTGVDYADGTAKCYEVTDITSGTTTPITVSTTPLAVFPGGSTSYAMELTPSGTTQVNLNLPSSTAGKTLILIMTAVGEDQSSNIYSFAGAEIFVVNP